MMILSLSTVGYRTTSSVFYLCVCFFNLLKSLRHFFFYVDSLPYLTDPYSLDELFSTQSLSGVTLHLKHESTLLHGRNGERTVLRPD